MYYCTSMPLRSRRRRKKPMLSRPENRSPYPPGQSPLELLPVEILCNIFVESQNTEFVLTSKIIYSTVGKNPSNWLLLNFFGHNISKHSCERTSTLFTVLLNISREVLCSNACSSISRIYVLSISPMA